MSGNNIPTGNKSLLYIIYLYNENDHHLEPCVHYIIDGQRCLVECFPVHQAGLGLEEYDIVGLLIWFNYAKL